MADQEFGEVYHDWFSLHMEIPQNFVAPPASNEDDAVIFDAVTEEFHGACCPKGSCREIMMRESKMGSHEEFYCGLEVGHNFSGGLSSVPEVI